jgi:murein DD-endopeptidase MepM/ murein hydrolase activator NlpD
VDEGRFGRGLTWRGRRITHRGVDVSAEEGTPVRAVADALVGYADNTVRGYGNLLVLMHGGGEVSSYAHLSAVHVGPGQRVEAGQVVALAGNTGISRGPHLHFEWRENGELADPMRRFPTAVVPAWMQAEFKSND